MIKIDKTPISRRDFLKAAGAGTVVTAAALAGCKPGRGVSAEGGATGDIPADQMAYRVNSITGDRVSLLGYGCMRWPVHTNADGQQEIDQEKVNELVDYAIAHGVNYFDTAPVYIRGWSEAATGIALARHPRDKWFIATKASRDVTLEQGKEMYLNSMKELRVDYLDYYLLHNVGSSIESFHARFIDNGFLDFLLAERAAGRIRNLGWSFHGQKEVFDYVLAYNDIQWDFCQIQLNYQDWTIPIGAAIDLGAELKLLGDHLKLSVALNDLGFIQWGRKSSYEGDLDDILLEYRGWNTALNGADITMPDGDEITVRKTGNEGYSKRLATNLNIGAEWNFFDNLLGLGVLSHTKFWNHAAHSELTLTGTVRPAKWFTASLSHTLIANKFGIFGAAINFHPRGVNIFMGMDYIPAQYAKFEFALDENARDRVGPAYMIFPSRLKSFNLYMGFAFTLGREKPW